jgi:hypothetical protein
MSVLTVPRPGWGVPPSLRALRLELKRNAVPYLLPLLAALFYFNTIRTAVGYPPVWTVRASVITNDMMWEFSVFGAGLGAWAGSREGRRKTVDMVATTSRGTWSRLSIALAGTLCWMLLAFLAGVAVLYGQTAIQATWGGPPLWPVFVGAAVVTVVTVIGFTGGVLFPGRFTAPLAAIGVFVLDLVGFKEALSVMASGGAQLLPGHPASATYALLSPGTSVPLVDTGVYYHVAPDVAIVQVLFMGGLAVAVFGGLGLARGDGRVLRAVAAVVAAGGVAAASTAFVLAGTGVPNASGGWEIPALHSAASDIPLPRAENCNSPSGSGFQVCVHPAFDFDLDGVAAALDPVAAQIAGLPGAPVRAEEVAGVSGGRQVQSGISGNPPVFQFTAEHVGNYFGVFQGVVGPASALPFQLGLLESFLAGSSDNEGSRPVPQLGPAQLAVERALLTLAGAQPGMQEFAKGKPDPATTAAIFAAADRFMKLSAGARHAWLAAHLTALRAGTITLARLP